LLYRQPAFGTSCAPGFALMVRARRSTWVAGGGICLVAVLTVTVIAMSGRTQPVQGGPLSHPAMQRNSSCVGPGPVTFGVDVLRPHHKKLDIIKLIFVGSHNVKRLGTVVVPMSEPDALGLAQGYPGDLPSDMSWAARRTLPTTITGRFYNLLVGLKRMGRVGKVRAFIVDYRVHGTSYFYRYPESVTLKTRCGSPPPSVSTTQPS
jgi:hypothetical protein